MEKEVIVKDIQMEFMSMVSFMVKWVLASIPAMIVLFCIGSIFMSLMAIFF